jgi:predicted outer membrane protein
MTRHGLRRALAIALLGAAAMTHASDQAPPAPAASPTPAARPASPEADLEDFVPSEKVGADEAVAFPTDI